MSHFDYMEYADSNSIISPIEDYSPFTIDGMVTTNKEMKRILKLANRIAGSDASVLITGHSGVGKELLAEHIHNSSPRHNQPFIKLNCAAIPESLIESEFFGYEPGAFTNASNKGKKGVMELAEKGTLFLDEIGEMPLHLQAKLLRVLQDKKYRRVGGERELRSDVRIIAATNKNLENLVYHQQFRQDLYFRLNVIPIYLPPLIERKDDIPLLTMYYIHFFNRQYCMNKKISVSVMEQLLHYSWPGNIRELKNTIERLILISMKEVLTVDDLNYSNFPPQSLNHYDKTKKNNHYIDQNHFSSLKELVEAFEIDIIKQAIEKYGSLRKAAKILKVTPSTLSRKLANHQQKNAVSDNNIKKSKDHI